MKALPTYLNDPATGRSGRHYPAARLSARRSKPMKWLSALVVLTVVLGADLAGSAESLVGKWKTVDDKSGKVESEVQLYEEGGKLFGKIVGLTEPNDDNGKPKTCTKCTGADKDKPIVGLVIVKDLSPSGDRYKDGTILDPADGKIYKAELWAEDGKLKVRGYLSVFYKTQTWIKGN
jgi:uncharacterized protein (DUF2147 family)